MPENIGRWVYRNKDQHHCLLPHPSKAPGAVTGDIWECTCKTQWVVKVNDDQRDGTWFDWTEKVESIPYWRD